MRTKLNLVAIVVSVMLVTMAWTLPVLAGTNQATDPGSGGVTLSSSATITVNPAALSIVKQARDLNGNILPSPATVAGGTQIYFVLYVDNTTNVTLNDARIIDTIATGAGNFTVDPASFEILNTVASPGLQMTAANSTQWTMSGSGAGTWNGFTWSTLTPAQSAADQLDWNVSAANRVTIGQPINAALNVAISSVPATEPFRAAIRFRVTVNP